MLRLRVNSSGSPPFVVPHRIDAVGRARRRVDDVHRQHVAGLGAVDMERPGNDVRPEPAMLHLGVDRDGIGQHLFARNAEAGEKCLGRALIGDQPFMRDRVDRDRLARPDKGDRVERA